MIAATCTRALIDIIQFCKQREVSCWKRKSQGSHWESNVHVLSLEQKPLTVVEPDIVLQSRKGTRSQKKKIIAHGYNPQKIISHYLWIWMYQSSKHITRTHCTHVHMYTYMYMYVEILYGVGLLIQTKVQQECKAHHSQLHTCTVCSWYYLFIRQYNMKNPLISLIMKVDV